MEANYALEPDMLRAFDRALTTERSAAGRQVLQILKENAQLAVSKLIPYCQDTGFVVCFVELGQDVHVTGGLLADAINEGVRQGYTEGYLRASIVRSPFDRVNTGDNTPAVIHLDLVAGATPTGTRRWCCERRESSADLRAVTKSADRVGQGWRGDDRASSAGSAGAIGRGEVRKGGGAPLRGLPRPPAQGGGAVSPSTPSPLTLT